MQANNAKAMSAHVPELSRPSSGPRNQAQDPKGWQLQPQSTYLCCFPQAQEMGSYPQCQGLRLCRSKAKAKAQTEAQVSAPPAAQTPTSAQATTKAPTQRLCLPMWGRRTGVTLGLLSAWGWGPPVLFGQTNLWQEKKKVLPFRQGTRQRSHYCHSNSAPNTVVLARLIRQEIN